MQPPRNNPYEAPQAPLGTVPLTEARRPRNLHHTKNTADDGWEHLRGVCGTLLLMLIPILAGMFFFWADHPILVGASLTFVILILGMVTAVAIYDIRLRGTFLCELNDTQFRCVSPNGWSGENFCLALQEIARVEHKSDSESSTCHLWNKQGERFWLTGSYDNPVEEFVDELKFRLSLLRQTNERTTDF